MQTPNKGLADNNEEGFILNESGTSVTTDHTDDDGKEVASTGSKSDPQKTEMDGLKKGGVEPNVHPEDKGHNEKGEDD